MPPSTNSRAPVTYEASSEAKNRIAAATSSALPGRFSIVPCAALALYCSTVSPAAAMRRPHRPSLALDPGQGVLDPGCRPGSPRHREELEPLLDVEVRVHPR